MIQIKKDNLNILAEKHCQGLKGLVCENVKKYKDDVKNSTGFKYKENTYVKFHEFLNAIDENTIESLLKGNKEVLMACHNKLKGYCDEFSNKIEVYGIELKEKFVTPKKFMSEVFKNIKINESQKDIDIDKEAKRQFKNFEKNRQKHLNIIQNSKGYKENNPLCKDIKTLIDCVDVKLVKAILLKDESGLTDYNKVNEDCENIENEINRIKLDDKDIFITDLLLKIFDYKGFSNKNSSGYNAFDFAKGIGINTCPYCNKQYTHTIFDEKTRNKVLRPDLDHFIPKSKYPYLALSFYNLIPCCQICNSRFKLNDSFTFEGNLHPYTEGWGEQVKFRLKIKDLGFFFGKEEIKIDEKKEKTAEIEINTDSANGINEKAVNNIQIFRLKDVYQEHTDYVFELVNKAMIYNDDYIDSLYKQFEGSIFRNREDVLRFVTANYVDDNSLHLRPLSKLTKDIVEQFDL
jgi:hypothetical protein